MSGERDPKGKFHPQVWLGEDKYLGLLSLGCGLKACRFFQTLVYSARNRMELPFIWMFCLLNIDWLQRVHLPRTCLSLTAYTTFKSCHFLTIYIYLSPNILVIPKPFLFCSEGFMIVCSVRVLESVLKDKVALVIQDLTILEAITIQPRNEVRTLKAAD